MHSADGPRAIGNDLPPDVGQDTIAGIILSAERLDGHRTFSIDVPAYTKELPPVPQIRLHAKGMPESRRGSFTQLERGSLSPNTRAVLMLEELLESGRTPIRDQGGASPEKAIERKDSLEIELVKMMGSIMADKAVRTDTHDCMLLSYKVGKLEIPLLYELFQAGEKDQTLKPSLAQLLPIYKEEPWFFTLTQELMKISAEKCEKSSPYREAMPGATFFISYLRYEFTKNFGNFHFAFMAHKLIVAELSKAANGSTAQSSPKDKGAAAQSSPKDKAQSSPKDKAVAVQPSPKEEMVKEITNKFLKALALLFSSHFHEKSPLIRTLSEHFIQLAKACEFTLMTPELLLINFIFLRCINPELTTFVAAIDKIVLGKDGEAKERLLRIKSYLIELMKRLQALATDKQMLPQLQIVLASVLSLPKESIAALIKQMNELQVS